MVSNQSKSIETRIYLNSKINIGERAASTGNKSFIVLLSQIDICIYLIDDPYILFFRI